VCFPCILSDYCSQNINHILVSFVAKFYISHNRNKICQDAAITYASIDRGHSNLSNHVITSISTRLALTRFLHDAPFKYEGSNEEINFTLLAWSCRTMYIEVQQQISFAFWKTEIVLSFQGWIRDLKEGPGHFKGDFQVLKFQSISNILSKFHGQFQRCFQNFTVTFKYFSKISCSVRFFQNFTVIQNFTVNFKDFYKILQKSISMTFPKFNG
jgi:hypothetical protein